VQHYERNELTHQNIISFAILWRNNPLNSTAPVFNPKMLEELEKILESEEMSLEERAQKIFDGCRMHEFCEYYRNLTMERYLELCRITGDGRILSLELDGIWVPMVKYKGLIVPTSLAKR